jgi:hypothetical protein
MIEIEILPGLKMIVDPAKFTVQGGMSVALSEQWSNDLIINFDVSIRDILENGHESKVDGVVTLRKKP